jgi:uncharacterized membrane protein YeaQ/YmgE (transglycosylase-associated protein family)
MVKAIQIGLGHWGFSWTRDVIPKVPNVEMVGYVDSNPDALKNAQTELGIEETLCFTSLEEAVQGRAAQLAICTLRTEAHYPVVKACLELGLSVIVEKPFASTIAQAKELVAMAQERGRVLMVSQNYRFQPAPILAAELIGAQRFGPVNLVSIDFRRHAPTQGYRYWDMPDPLLADMSIHHFDLMRMVLGDEPKRVSCRTWNSPASPFGHNPIGVATLDELRPGDALVGRMGDGLLGGRDHLELPRSLHGKIQSGQIVAPSARRHTGSAGHAGNRSHRPRRHARRRRQGGGHRHSSGPLQLGRGQSSFPGTCSGDHPFCRARRGMGRNRRGHGMSIGTQELLIFLAIGLVAGWIAGLLLGGGGLIRNLIVGVIGSFVGGWLLSAVGVSLPIDNVLISQIITATIGAIVVIALARIIAR